MFASRCTSLTELSDRISSAASPMLSPASACMRPARREFSSDGLSFTG